MLKIILFGAGNVLKETLRYLDGSKAKVIAICDNDQSKWGKYLQGIKIISPNEIKKCKSDMIIISNITYQDSIKRQLRAMGCERVLPLYAQDYTQKEKVLYDKVINLYGKMVLGYKKSVQKQIFFPTKMGLWHNPYYFSRKKLAKYINKYSGYIKGKCMDFGCGTKPYEQLFNVEEYVGVEIESETKVEDIVYYDGKTLPFEDACFDSIVAFQVYEHVPNLDEITDELGRVLKKGGYMLITMPFTYSEHLTPYDFRRFTSYGMMRHMKEHGFEVVHYEKSGNFIETIAQMKNVYINEHMFENSEFIRKCFCLGTNLKGVLYSRMLPENKDLYLDNVILVKKI